MHWLSSSIAAIAARASFRRHHAILLFYFIILIFISRLTHDVKFALKPEDFAAHLAQCMDGIKLVIVFLFCTLILVGYRNTILPLRGVARQLNALSVRLPGAAVAAPAGINIRLLAREMGHLAQWAQECYHQHQEMSAALSEARQVNSRLALEYSTAIRSASLQVTQQYQSVLSYANYLEEQIERRRLDPGLRYDFDDACESSFNLKLIGSALLRLKAETAPVLSPMPLAGLMQQTMLALASSLDRRSMRLSTAEVDESVQACTDPTITTQALWMILLGIIRYAEAESTLRLRCLTAQDGRYALISIAVSELAPGALSVAEREAHLLRQLQHLTPHMFAETIRIHANLQLAELLMKQLSARIDIVPLTSYACEICLFLPTAAPRG